MPDKIVSRVLATFRHLLGGPWPQMVKTLTAAGFVTWHTSVIA